MFPRPWGEQIPQSLPQGRAKFRQQEIGYELGLGVRGRLYEEQHFPKYGMVEHWTLILTCEEKKKKTKPCTPVSLEIDADFIYFYLEIHHAHQHIGGSNKSCWIEFDRLLSHYGLPNFHGQRTIFCLWPSRPLLPLLPSLLDWVLTAGKRTKVPPGYPQVQSWII